MDSGEATKIQSEASSLYLPSFHPSFQSPQVNTFSMKMKGFRDVTNESLRYFPGANTMCLGRRGIMHARWMFLYFF